VSWFIRNIRDVQWYDGGPAGVYGDFEQGERFPEFGFNFGVVWPGQPVALYHREDHQERFLVLFGECLLIVEGEERALRQWDYFHCPAGVAPSSWVPVTDLPSSLPWAGAWVPAIPCTRSIPSP
jgi:hypothetical protein